jgi:hypothetical protein
MERAVLIILMLISLCFFSRAYAVPGPYDSDEQAYLPAANNTIYMPANEAVELPAAEPAAADTGNMICISSQVFQVSPDVYQVFLPSGDGIDPAISNISFILDTSNYCGNRDASRDTFSSGQMFQAITDAISMMFRLARDESGNSAAMLRNVKQIVFSDYNQTGYLIQGGALDGTTGTLYLSPSFMNNKEMFPDADTLKGFLISTIAHEASHARDWQMSRDGTAPYPLNNQNGNYNPQFCAWTESRAYAVTDHWEKIWADYSGEKYTGRFAWVSLHFQDNGYNGLLVKGNTGQLNQILYLPGATDARMIGLDQFDRLLFDKGYVPSGARTEYIDLRVEYDVNNNPTGYVTLSFSVNGQAQFAKFRMWEGGIPTTSTKFIFALGENSLGIP